MDIYADIILDLWRNPANFGQLDNADLEAYELNPLCGDEIKIQIKLKGLNGQSKVKDCKFTGNGCAISVASTSLLTEFAKDKSLPELVKITEKDIFKFLGIEIGPQRIKCAILPLAVLRKAVNSFDEKIEGAN